MRIEAVLVALLIAAPACQAGGVPEPAGYRTEAYRAPVPDTLSGATVVDAAQARSLWEDGETAFVDVFPRPPKPDNLPEGTLWIDKPRETVPGAVWLPNTGHGLLPEDRRAYLEDGLAAVTGGDPEAPVLFFCQANCWMSWNAAKRAVEELGYTAVYWFPEGLDGWAAEGLPLERMQPWAP